mmetsp:Transcript_60049/g.117755  ORF Transcript_60049/g.117755 Transcript_60049/m.117755 type:complete len:185 (+) Transcript_60049:62-616(+)
MTDSLGPDLPVSTWSNLISESLLPNYNRKLSNGLLMCRLSSGKFRVSCCVKRTEEIYQFFAREFDDSQLRSFLGDEVGVEAGSVSDTEEIDALGSCFAGALKGPIQSDHAHDSLLLQMDFSLSDDDDPISHSLTLQEVEGGAILPVLFDDVAATLNCSEPRAHCQRKRSLTDDGDSYESSKRKS